MKRSAKPVRFIPSAPSIRRHFSTTSFPDDWATPHLDSLVAEDAPVSYGILMPGDHFPGGIPVIKVKDYVNGRLDLASVMRTTPEIDAQYRRSRVKTGDTLISIRGGTGDVVVVSPELDGANITQDTARIRGNEKVHGDFLPHVLRGEFVATQIQLDTIGQAVTGINIGSIRRLVIPLPPLPEQRKIADILGTWDEALEKLDALIVAKERRKQALMQQLLTGKRRLPGFSKPWEYFRVGELMKSEDRYVNFDDDHLYHLVSARRRAEGVFFREALYGRDIKTKVMKQVHAGDFVISRMQVVHGGLGVVPAECDGYYASDSYEVLVPRSAKMLSTRFIGHLCKTRRFWHHALVCSHGVHIEKMTFVMADFEHEKFSVPALTEQNAIADILDAADAELRLLRQQHTNLEQQKRGLMQQLLTGKVRVFL